MPEPATRRVTFPVGGMTCAACQSAVERSLMRTDGVREAAVNLMLHSATVTYDPSVVPVEGLLDAVRDIGYEADAPAEGDALGAPAKAIEPAQPLVLVPAVQYVLGGGVSILNR